MSTETFTAPGAVPPRELPDGTPPAPVPARWRALAGELPWPVIAGCLVALTALSAWRRTIQFHFYYWVDEGISVGIASHPLGHIPTLMRQDGSPPLYYLILHVWMAAFGRDEVATHALSLVFALLAIPAAYWAAASLFDRRTGLIAAFLAALVPYLTAYAQETRMYSLVALLSILVAASFVHVFVRHRRRYLPVFSLSLVVAAYSHNWALFLGLTCGLAFLWCLRCQPAERRVLWRDGLIGFGAVVLLYLPWLPTLLYQTRHTGAPWDLPPVFWSITQGLYALVGGRGAAMVLLLAGGAGLWSLRRLSLAGGQLEGAVAPAPGSALAGGTASAAPEARIAGGPRPWPRLAAEVLLILGLGTMLVAWAYSKHSPAWAVRYFAAMLGPLLLLFALGLRRGRGLALFGLVLLAGFWILDPVAQNLNSKSNVAAVAADARRHLGSDPLVLSTQPEQVPVIAYYLPTVRRFGTPLGPVADPRVVDWRDALAKLRRSSVQGVLEPMLARMRPGQRVFLFVPVNFPKAPAWMKLINRSTGTWYAFLQHDPHLRYFARSDAHYYSAGVAEQAFMYLVR